jgi:hypothetical protein
MFGDVDLNKSDVDTLSGGGASRICSKPMNGIDLSNRTLFLEYS